MRAAFGLVSILVTLAIILYLMAGRSGPGGTSYLGTVAKTNKQARVEVNSFAGRDPQGRPAHESLTLGAWPETGDLRGLVVQQIDPMGAAAMKFGLQPGDVIVRIGPHPVGEAIVGSVEDGQIFLDEAYARSQPLTVRRNGSEIDLPGGGGTTPPAAGIPAAPGVGGGPIPVPNLGGPPAAE